MARTAKVVDALGERFQARCLLREQEIVAGHTEDKDDQGARLDREELARAGVLARTRLDQIEEDFAAQSREDVETSFVEVRDALLGTSGPVEQLTRDLMTNGAIAPGRRVSVVSDNACLWEVLAMLEVMLLRLRSELTDDGLAALGIRP